jgi:hypothetical protein
MTVKPGTASEACPSLDQQNDGRNGTRLARIGFGKSLNGARGRRRDTNANHGATAQQGAAIVAATTNELIHGGY